MTADNLTFLSLGFSISLFAVAPQPASADVRTGGSIAYTVEATGPSGGKIAGGNVVIDSAIGTPAGGSSLDNPFTTNLRNGFAGQLYDIIGLSLTADPAPVEEEARTRLNAQADLDDGSTINLDPTDVSWSVVGGPITDPVAASGLAGAEPVYEDTQATVAGNYLGANGSLDITVRDVFIDNFPPVDGDGLPDLWQATFFLGAFELAGPQDDPDGEGLVNLVEYGIGSIPTNALSGHDLLPAPMLLPAPGPAQESTPLFLSVTFKRRQFPAPVTYIVEVESDLASTNWDSAVQSGEAGAPDGDGLVTVTFRDTISIDDATPPRFIRLRIDPVPESVSGD